MGKSRITFLENIDFIGENLFENECNINDKELLVKCLKTLTESERQAVELYFFSGHSQAQIAEILGISFSAVSQNIRRGVRKLKKNLSLFK